MHQRYPCCLRPYTLNKQKGNQRGTLTEGAKSSRLLLIVGAKRTPRTEQAATRSVLLLRLSEGTKAGRLLLQLLRLLRLLLWVLPECAAAATKQTGAWGRCIVLWLSESAEPASRTGCARVTCTTERAEHRVAGGRACLSGLAKETGGLLLRLSSRTKVRLTKRAAASSCCLSTLLVVLHAKLLTRVKRAMRLYFNRV